MLPTKLLTNWLNDPDFSQIEGPLPMDQTQLAYKRRRIKRILPHAPSNIENIAFTYENHPPSQNWYADWLFQVQDQWTRKLNCGLKYLASPDPNCFDPTTEKLILLQSKRRVIKTPLSPEADIHKAQLEALRLMDPSFVPTQFVIDYTDDPWLNFPSMFYHRQHVQRIVYPIVHLPKKGRGEPQEGDPTLNALRQVLGECNRVAQYEALAKVSSVVQYPDPFATERQIRAREIRLWFPEIIRTYEALLHPTRATNNNYPYQLTSLGYILDHKGAQVACSHNSNREREQLIEAGQTDGLPAVVKQVGKRLLCKLGDYQFDLPI